MDNNDKIIYTKHDFTWHYVSMYLDALMITAVGNDEEFMRLYRQLHEYVDSKVFTPCGGDMVEMCVLIGRKIK